MAVSTDAQYVYPHSQIGPSAMPDEAFGECACTWLCARARGWLALTSPWLTRARSSRLMFMTRREEKCLARGDYLRSKCLSRSIVFSTCAPLAACDGHFISCHEEGAGTCGNHDCSPYHDHREANCHVNGTTFSKMETRMSNYRTIELRVLHSIRRSCLWQAGPHSRRSPRTDTVHAVMADLILNNHPNCAQSWPT